MPKSKSSKSSDNKLNSFVNLIVLAMVGAIVIGILFPMMDSLGLQPLREATPQLSQIINALPLMVGLGFLIGVIFAFIKLIKPE